MCKAKFSTKCSLRVHSRLHTGARPYQCEVCGRAFRTSGHRNTHMSTHGRQRARRPAGDAAEDGQARPAAAQAETAETAETRRSQTAGQALSAQLQVRGATRGRG